MASRRASRNACSSAKTRTSSSSLAYTSTRATAKSTLRTTTRWIRWWSSRRGANGDMAPERAVHTPHGTFGIAVDENAARCSSPRSTTSTSWYTARARTGTSSAAAAQGDDTGLADPHGIAIDPRDEVFFVANYGSRALRRGDRSSHRVPGAGRDAGRRTGRSAANTRFPAAGPTREPSITRPRAVRQRATTGPCASSRARRRS